VPEPLAALIRAEFPAAQWVNAGEISYLESGWRADAEADTRWRADGELGVEYTMDDGRSALTEWAVGYYQINIGAHGGDFATWSDPARNVAKARELWGYSGWSPWYYSAQSLGLL
jgi:hypothetical protein